MHLLHVFVAAQLAAPLQRHAVLALPERGVDDPAAYQGYATRFFRDAAGNTVQIYMDERSGRLVHLLANADNESAALTIRGATSQPRLTWGSGEAVVRDAGGFRTLSHRVVAHASHVHIGWFLLGSMRVERDFQYWKRHVTPFASPAFMLTEHERLLEAMGRLPAAARRRHLQATNASSVAALRARLSPRVTVHATAASWRARISQLSLDGRDSITLEVAVDPRRVAATRVGDSLSLRARTGDSVALSVTVGSSARALAPLTRAEIFTPAFLEFLRGARDSLPLLERQVRGVELLASREKLMAGLPAYATYFGRDMLVSALMMQPIWRPEVPEFVIASVLRRLSPAGEVSHEEALGGQAVREAAAEYASLVERAMSASPGARDSLLDVAGQVLRDQRRVRENYHMVDDELQFPILVARWLADPRVSAERKRAFLTDTTDLGEPRLHRLLRELALVAQMTAPYAAEQSAANLIPFAPRDSGRWASASWRDSGAGYANGRFGMDVNAIWAPHALESIGAIVRALSSIGISLDSLSLARSGIASGSPLLTYLRDSSALARATDAWWNASRHFVVRLSPAEVRERAQARLAALPAAERAHWTRVLERTGADRDSLTFLALALDAQGRPIGVANTDVATRLFLGERPGVANDTAALLRDVRLFTRAYPVGLLIDAVGPVVANDAYATAPVWEAFERDQYHGPRVVWGREVNLFALGVAQHVARAPDAPYATELRAAVGRVLAAAEASGFQSELWSYEVGANGVTPARYGTGSDVQLWSTTDLAVFFALAGMRR